MKTKIKEILNTLRNVTGLDYTYSDLAVMLKNTTKKPTVGALQNRFYMDGYLSEEEVSAIENFVGVSLSNRKSIENIEINYYPDIFASCGSGCVVFEETKETIGVPKTMIQNFSDSKKYSVINSRGDSMTPFIQDRDKLIVEHWQGGQIIDNCVYVFRYANELFVKRLVKNVTQIVIKSDNPIYEPIKIEGKDTDFEVIGQIVGLMRDMR
jgi:phage repressor protein C with HTH and peptisase S24 domain